MVPPSGRDASRLRSTASQPFASLQQRLGRKVVSDKTLNELPVAFIAYDLLETRGPRHPRRAASANAGRSSKRLVEEVFAAAKGRNAPLPLRISPLVAGETGTGSPLPARRRARFGREGLMLKARDGAYGVGRRKGDDRVDVWWKWKLDPMSVDAVLIYAQRGHGRRSGVYSDYTFAVWSAPEEDTSRELVPFAKAYSGLSDAEMREMDAIIRKHHRRDLRPGAQRQADPGVRAWLRRHRAEQAPQERHRRPLPPHAPLAPRQAGRGGRHARRAAGAAAGGKRRVRGRGRPAARRPNEAEGRD